MLSYPYMARVIALRGSEPGVKAGRRCPVSLRLRHDRGVGRTIRPSGHRDSASVPCQRVCDGKEWCVRSSRCTLQYGQTLGCTRVQHEEYSEYVLDIPCTPAYPRQRCCMASGKRWGCKGVLCSGSGSSSCCYYPWGWGDVGNVPRLWVPLLRRPRTSMDFLPQQTMISPHRVSSDSSALREARIKRLPSLHALPYIHQQLIDGVDANQPEARELDVHDDIHGHCHNDHESKDVEPMMRRAAGRVITDEQRTD